MNRLPESLTHQIASYSSIPEIFKTWCLLSKEYHKISKLPITTTLVRTVVSNDLCYPSLQNSNIMTKFKGKTLQQIFENENFGWKKFYESKKLVVRCGLSFFF